MCVALWMGVVVQPFCFSVLVQFYEGAVVAAVVFAGRSYGQQAVVRCRPDVGPFILLVFVGVETYKKATDKS